MSQLTIIYPKKRSDFAYQYDCELRPQPGGIEVDPEEKTLGVYCNGNINGTPEDVWHGRRLWYRINDPMHTTIAEISALIDEAKPYAERICAGYDTEWDGNNWVGSLNEDAEEAAQTIAQIVGEFYPSPENGLFDDEDDDDEENEDEEPEYECEIFTEDELLKFEDIEDARTYFYNLPYEERKKIIRENICNTEFPGFPAEKEKN